MYKIILLDDNKFLKSILATNLFKIELIILDNKCIPNIKKLYKKNLSNTILYPKFPSDIEFNNIHTSNYNLTYEEIKIFKNTQLKVERYYHRLTSDLGIIQYRYYTALSFWLNFFQNNKIDLLIITDLEHGGHWDSIPIDIAIHYNIPVYNIAVASGFGKKSIHQILHLNDRTFLDLSKANLPQVNLQKYLKALTQDTTNFLHHLKYPYHKKIKNILRSFRYSIASPHKIFYRDSSSHINHFLEKYKFHHQITYVRNLQKYYDQISDPSPSIQENYIYYPLHFEPEASIMVRTPLENQLYIIKLVAELLPKGWKLYVKEHPHQFTIYKDHDFFLKNIEFYRTPKYYQQIKNTKNTVLINSKIRGLNLIQNCKATISITGSSILEAITFKKPVIIFGDSLNFSELLSDTFKVTSLETLSQALQKIEQGNWKPNYSDLEDIINKHTFEINNQNYDTSLQNLFMTISKHHKRQYNA
ncbi:hypothetical protein F7P74_07790 [Helicobacter pullorum NCTC 12824]|uniref:capsular polysaccharide export protein, LipB/KpsS family n=1 Tax=Helicobacter pullorum TaxID=35818 RepID=UPI001243A8F1|nr:hypothetical protein [Helicobacter pullorum]KAB0574180.1 hypothetical protein F7P74_07790 [Helicobacter pullorum NCTC 12824]